MSSATGFVKNLIEEYKKDDIGDAAAALAYYATFSIVPMLLLVIAIGGFFFGQESTQQQLMTQLDQLLGPSGAAFIQNALQNSGQLSSGENIFATILGIVLVFLGATRFFVRFQVMLNRVWDVAPNDDAGMREVVKKRLTSFGVLAGVGILLLLSTVLSAFVAGAVDAVAGSLPGGSVAVEVANYALTFVLATGMFAVIYRYFPDAEVGWKDVWLGAAFTVALLLLGKFLIGLYIASGSLASTYGAAASIIIFLLWMYVSMQIVLIGAEFTQVWANRHGRAIEPEGHAQPA